VLSRTSVFTATTLKSKSSKSRRRDCSVASAARLACEPAFAQAARDPSAHAVPAAEKSDRAPMHRVATSRVRREVNLNRDVNVRKPLLVGNPMAP
jgi:hypothetical protein